MGNQQLERRLDLGTVVAISISTMLGSGIFVLPGLAFAKTGSSVFLAYLVAGIFVVPAALSKAELATAMPTSGGTYVYLERTFGPATGTVAGLGLWMSLLLKSAFALMGFGAYLSVLADMDIRPMALLLLVLITFLNLVGVRKVGQAQTFVVIFSIIGLLVLMAVGLWDWELRIKSPAPFFEHGFSGFFAAAGFVFVSFAGVTKIAAIAEEVKNPNRNIPLGIILSLVCAMTIYGFVVFVLSSFIPASVFSEDLHPIYTLAVILKGHWFGIVFALIGIVTMVSMANAGVLAASRFPFAMSRDNLLPSMFRKVDARFKTPTIAIVFTTCAMGCAILFLNVEKIAKLASSFMIMAFMMVNLAVIVLRELPIQWYKPTYKSPLYPGLQIFGLASGGILLALMGFWGLLGAIAIGLVGGVLYLVYGRRFSTRTGVIGKRGRRQDLITQIPMAAGPRILETDLDAFAPVAVPLFGKERSPEMLVEMGGALANHQPVQVVHITEVPEQTSLDAGFEEDQSIKSLRRRVNATGEVKDFPVDFTPLVSHDQVYTVYNLAQQDSTQWICMAWRGRSEFGVALQNPLGWLVHNLPCNLAVFKDGGVRYVRKILVYAKPGPHDALVASTADHLAELFRAELTFVRVVGADSGEHKRAAEERYLRQLQDLCRSKSTSMVVEGEKPSDAVAALTGGFDLLVAGAAHNRSWLRRLKSVAVPSLIEKAECSVLTLSTPQARTHQSFEPERISSIGPAFNLTDYLVEKGAEAHIRTERKDRVFQRIAEDFHRVLQDVPTEDIYNALWARERTQNTALGQGLALPHASIPHLEQSYVAIFTTATPIDYGASDGEKVDVFVATIGTLEDRNTHLKILASVARMVTETDVLSRLRTARSAAELIERFKGCHDEVNW